MGWVSSVLFQEFKQTEQDGTFFEMLKSTTIKHIYKTIILKTLFKIYAFVMLYIQSDGITFL